MVATRIWPTSSDCPSRTRTYRTFPQLPGGLETHASSIAKVHNRAWLDGQRCAIRHGCDNQLTGLPSERKLDRAGLGFAHVEIELYKIMEYECWGTNPRYARVDGTMIAGHYYSKQLAQE